MMGFGSGREFGGRFRLAKPLEFDVGNQAALDANVADQLAVAQDQVALAEMRDVELVGHHDDRDPLVV